jgi:hypothetical protein
MNGRPLLGTTLERWGLDPPTPVEARRDVGPSSPEPYRIDVARGADRRTRPVPRVAGRSTAAIPRVLGRLERSRSATSEGS